VKQRSKKSKLTVDEAGALRFVKNYGDGIDFGGSGVSNRSRRVARQLIERGLLGGDYRNCYLTDSGRAALDSLR
jgi:hypothetical protein